MMRLFLLLILLSLHGSTQLYSQIGEKGKDSASSLVDSLFWEQLKDTVERAGLEAQLKALQLNETNARLELEKQLDTLKNRDSLKIASQIMEIEKLRGITIGYPVTGPFGDTLFLFIAVGEAFLHCKGRRPSLNHTFLNFI
jgi:hypothetical protein